MMLYLCFALWMLTASSRSEDQLTLKLDQHTHYDPLVKKYYPKLKCGPFPAAPSMNPIVKFTGAEMEDDMQANLTDFHDSYYHYRAMQPGVFECLKTEDADMEGKGYADLHLDSLTYTLIVMDAEMRELKEKRVPIRLVGGNVPTEGRVEILVGDEWGTVCDDLWDDLDAKVVCRSLGFYGAGATAISRAAFGQGAGLILLDDVKCTGTEKSILMCPSKAFNHENCAHSEDAGVKCVAT